MPHKVKEDERIEMIIRGLLKQPENRRCINCNSLGPQYVCTTFWTFVCTNCSGVHREFTHRIKSVSMAKFNAEEVSALQAGGNERAKEIYFKAWDPQRNSFPDGSNLHRLRDFIKHIYVDRKYTGERTFDKLAMVKVGERRSFERSSHGSRDDYYDRHSFERSMPSGRNNERSLRHYIDERSSPQYRQESMRSSGHRSRTAHFEIVDDRVRDDGVRSGRRPENLRFSNVELRVGSMSPDPRRSREMSSPPVVRPVRDILGNVPALQVGKRPKENDGRDADGSDLAQNTACSSTTGPTDVKEEENTKEISSSLIDFSSDPNPADTASAPQTQQTAPSGDGTNSSSTTEKAPNASNVNSLESLLFGLSVPAVVPSDVMSEAPSSIDVPSATPASSSSSYGVGDTVTPSTTNTRAVHSNGGDPATSPKGNEAEMPSSGGDWMSNVTDGSQLQTTQQHQPSASPGGTVCSSVQQSNSSVEDLFNQPWTSSSAPNAQAPPPNTPAEQSSQTASKTAQDTSSGDGSNTDGRKELPADLFTMSYSPYPAPVPSWQFHPSHGMGFNMQYHPAAMQLPDFPNSAKSTNPFDLTDDNTQVRAPMFPSVASLHGALPQVSAHTGLQPQPSPYPSVLVPQSPSYGMSMSPESYMGQQLPNNSPPPRPHGTSGYGGGIDAFASLNPIQQNSGTNVTPAAPNSFSYPGGNPFG